MVNFITKCKSAKAAINIAPDFNTPEVQVNIYDDGIELVQPSTSGLTRRLYISHQQFEEMAEFIKVVQSK